MGLVGAVALATVLPAIVAGTGGANALILIGVAMLLLVVGIAVLCNSRTPCNSTRSYRGASQRLTS